METRDRAKTETWKTMSWDSLETRHVSQDSITVNSLHSVVAMFSFLHSSRPIRTGCSVILWNAQTVLAILRTAKSTNMRGYSKFPVRFCKKIVSYLVRFMWHKRIFVWHCFFSTPLKFNAPMWRGSPKDICYMFDVVKLESLCYNMVFLISKKMTAKAPVSNTVKHISGGTHTLARARLAFVTYLLQWWVDDIGSRCPGLYWGPTFLGRTAVLRT